ncbi:UNVERIFIED_CONTAM: hypothetical protein GTU68_043266 [Idotea baltica]|nr:hypothetical protein [Idotea baltica]
MKRGASRDISPSSKRSRSSLGRFEDSSEDEGRRSSRGGSPSGRRYLPPEPIHRAERDDYGRGVPRSIAQPSYKVLCVSNLHSKASDDMVRDALYREFKRFGDASVKVTLDSAGDRVAYVYFRSYEEAREAKHSKPRILFYDKPVVVEPIYDSPREYSLPRGRSRSPIDYDRAYRPRSPPVPDIDDHYEPRFDRGRPPPPHRDYYVEGPPPMRPEDYGYRPHRGRGPHHYGPPHRGGFKPHFGGGGGGGRGMMESKRDKFPNYLHHVAPEDDPLSTRTLFAGNLEINITEDELRRIFGRYGIVDDIDIKRPPPGTGNAYAFVRFQNLDMAHRAKIELSGQYIGKFQCKIGYGKVMPTTRCWVGGLGHWTSLTQLNQEFDRFGAIKKIEYHKGDSYAYILYESLDAAQAAVKEMRGFPLGGPDKKLRTDFAEVTPPPGGQFTAPAGEFREEWNSRTYEEYGGGGEFSGGFTRGRGRGRGWHERGRGAGHRGGYHNDFQRNEYRDYEGGENADGKNHGSEHGESQDGLGSSRTLADLTRMTTMAWQGSMILKNSTFATKLHVVEGDPDIAELLQDEKGQPLLKITQRLRLDQPRLDDVSRRINAPSNATILLSLPTTLAPPVPEEQGIQSRPLRNLVAYLKQKEAAGVITLNGSVGGVLYAFPPCAFSLDLLQRVAPSLTAESTRDDHLVVVIDRGSTA